jgi:hypothetical protein
MENLERAFAAHLHVLGQIHATHAPLPNLLEDEISVGDDRSLEIGPAGRVTKRGSIGLAKASVGGILNATAGANFRGRRVGNIHGARI